METWNRPDWPGTLITFDDGHRSTYENAFPVLRELGWVATVYVVPSFVGTERPFWWEELRQHYEGHARLPSLPNELQAATQHLKHVPDAERRRVLDALRQRSDVQPRQPQLTWDEIREMRDAGWTIGNHTWSHPCLDRCDDDVVGREILGAHEALTRELGQRPTTFAYPNGNYDERARRILEELGYETAFLFDHRLTPTPPPDLMRISRVRTNASSSLDHFKAVVTGAHPFVHHALGRP